MRKNYKLQNTKKTAHELHELTRISEKKETSITTTKGGHGLHQGSFKLQTMTALIKSFCGGTCSVSQWVSRSVMKSLLEQPLMSVVSKVSVVSELRRLKASIAVLKGNSKALYYIRHFTAFPADSFHLKKPSVGPKGLIGPPCHGALAAGGRKND